jgi:hypothetical protein
MANPGSALLRISGWISVAAAVTHLACIVGGPAWYRFFGAGEEMASAAARGSWVPALMTAAVAVILAIWAAYAFSAAGDGPRLPLTRTALVAISSVLLLRAVGGIPMLWLQTELSRAFLLWSSAIVLAYGLCFALGTWRAWPSLTEARRR